MNIFFRRAALAAVLTASLLFSSCGIITHDMTDDENTTDTTETSPPETSPVPDSGSAEVIDNTAAYEAVSDAYLSGIPARDFEGAPYVIAAPWTDVITGGDDGTVLSAAKHERNRKVEEQWNVSIVPSIVDANSFQTLVQAAVQADEYYADLLMIPQYMIGSFVADGSIMNLNSMPFLDLEQPYFNASSVEAATIGHKIYAAAGAASFEESTLTGMYFNRGLFETLGIDSPYAAVYDGVWTWDRFFAITASLSDINEANGAAYASFATHAAAESLPATVFFSAGGRFVRSDGKASPTLAYSAEDASIAERVRALFADPNAHKDTETGVTKFYTGESLFLLDRLYIMTWMPNGTQNWGVLPMPKADETQADYISPVDKESLFFAAQKNTADAERTAIILSALNAASYDLISDAYIDYAMYHLIRDNDSANMLEILIRSRTYDFSWSFGQTNSTLAGATYIGMQSVAGGTITFASLCEGIDNTNRQLTTKYPVDT